MLNNTNDYLDKDRRSVWHPFSKQSVINESDFPVITRGEGPFLFDNEGNRYLDAISSWWCCNLGHSHPRIVEAVQEQSSQLQHSILANLTHPKVVELAYKLVQYFPSDDRHVLFASDGASAVEAAMRIAIQYWYNLGKPEKHRFIALKDAYHGDTLGAMSLGFVSSFHAPYKDVVMPVYHADSPASLGCYGGHNSEVCQDQCLDQMRQMLKEHADELAAVVVEPHCQGAGGMRMYSSSYLKGLSDLCKEHGVLLIVDEIATGFGRTGRMFSFNHAGIDPDIVCLGKGLSAGYMPVSAAVVKQFIYETFTDKPVDNTFYHGHTFAGNPLGMAAALACPQVYEDEGIVQRAASLGNVLADEFESFRELPMIENVRQLGMIAAFNVKNGPQGESAVNRAHQVRRRLMQEEIMLRPLGNVLYLMLPLITSEELLRDTVSKLYNAVSELPHQRSK